ncbi:probable acetyl xylan esterase [Maribacter sp. HTCC2170]|nr:probable acetyl xylan esterase [Maribacter sp. HTCC2170]
MTYSSFAQSTPIYDENKVPNIQVPNPLFRFNGKKVNNTRKWIKKRRPELLKFFENNVYGSVPGKLDEVSFKVVEQTNNAYNGRSIRKQVEVVLTKNEHTLRFTVLIYLPKDKSKSPLFLGYNFYGNHTITNDPEVIVTEAWSRNNNDFGITNNTPTEKSRSARVNRWAIEKILDAGYGLATIYYGEVDPDKDDFSDGLHSLFYSSGQKPKTDEWGSIAAWAFGLSRAMDYLETDIHVDASKVVVFGHSRLGKAALWTGATDERFAGVISNNSGCGGATLSKRKFGETIGIINKRFPHWFCDNFEQYNENEEALPVDQHQLLALVAPRPLYVASAEKDRWADPKGEFLSAFYATPVYALFGKEGITSKEMPKVNHPIQNTVAYHVRTGKHNVTDYDWEQYIKWASRFVK